MNYAEDRLDRRARHAEGLLWKDYCLAFSTRDHSLLAKTLRDCGWNRRSLFHFGQAWILRPNDAMAAADYAQMAELSGSPTPGLVALWNYRLGGRLAEEPAENDDCFQLSKEASWLDQHEPILGDCGCGNEACGKAEIYVPFSMDPIESVFDSMRDCLREVEEGTASSRQLASEVLQQLATFKRQSCLTKIPLPAVLDFWARHTERKTTTLDFRPLPPACQLLFIKLLYLTIPSLAAMAVVHAFYDKKTIRILQSDFKSHWAFYIFIKAVIFGPECVKRGKRFSREYYHVPVWDLLWNLDWRRDTFHEINAMSLSVAPMKETIDVFVDRLRLSMLSFPSTASIATSTQSQQLRLWRFPETIDSPPPIVFIGDSHILSLAWQVLCFRENCLRRVVPFLVTGLKAWHVRRETCFFTQSCWKETLEQLQVGGSNIRTIVVSAGEIDCREGLGGSLLQGYSLPPQQARERVKSTVNEYLENLTRVAQLHKIQVLVMPVPPHLYSSKGRVESRRARRATTRQWNAELRRRLPRNHVFFLDYEASLVDIGGVVDGQEEDVYVLKNALNADSTHMNGAFCRHLEQAVLDSGCNLDLL